MISTGLILSSYLRQSGRKQEAVSKEVRWSQPRLSAAAGLRAPIPHWYLREVTNLIGDEARKAWYKEHALRSLPVPARRGLEDGLNYFLVSSFVFKLEDGKLGFFHEQDAWFDLLFDMIVHYRKGGRSPEGSEVEVYDQRTPSAAAKLYWVFDSTKEALRFFDWPLGAYLYFVSRIDLPDIDLRGPRGSVACTLGADGDLYRYLSDDHSLDLASNLTRAYSRACRDCIL